MSQALPSPPAYAGGEGRAWDIAGRG